MINENYNENEGCIIEETLEAYLEPLDYYCAGDYPSRHNGAE